MQIVITGGTGFIGGAVVRALEADGHDVTCLSRSPGPKCVVWTPKSEGAWTDEVARADAVIHLAGAGIADERWTDARKREIVESRTVPTELIARAVAGAQSKVRVLVSASAIGYYGFDDSGRDLDESSAAGDDFLARTCVAWERAADAARGKARVAHPRIGVVLGNGGGALAKMLPPFRAMVGGPVGSGRQVMSWVHLADAVRAIIVPISEERIVGAYDVTAPNPVTQGELARAIGRALGRPAVVPAPAFALELALGKERAEIVLRGQRVLPRRLLELGFAFRFPTIDEALADLLVR
jgi:uncharacterized protein (TIGR01777 family)